ncbi:hypothetical protein EDC01DRAFT_60480 [Geopyxis carbonaria]|nr:hypothetical protein EDC01DRAFT_60480 [Geopyxis carbonaria]
MGLLHPSPLELHRRQTSNEVRSRAQQFLRVCNTGKNWQTCATTGYGGCCSSNQGGCDSSCTDNVCSKNQKWYTCDTIGYAGCCTVNPCRAGGCPDNNSNLCANLGNGVKWYTCADGNFAGCCNEDPCGSGKCPDAGKKEDSGSTQSQKPESTSTSSLSRDTKVDKNDSSSSASVPETMPMTVTLSQVLTSTAAGGSVSRYTVTQVVGPTVTASGASSASNSANTETTPNLAVPIGAGVGGFLLIAVIIGAIFMFRRKRRNAANVDSVTESHVGLRGGSAAVSPESPHFGFLTKKRASSRNSQGAPPAYHDDGSVVATHVAPRELEADPSLTMAELPASPLAEMPADMAYDYRPMQEVNRGNGFLASSAAASTISINHNEDSVVGRDRKSPLEPGRY